MEKTSLENVGEKGKHVNYKMCETIMRTENIKYHFYLLFFCCLHTLLFIFILNYHPGYISFIIVSTIFDTTSQFLV